MHMHSFFYKSTRWPGVVGAQDKLSLNKHVPTRAYSTSSNNAARAMGYHQGQHKGSVELYIKDKRPGSYQGI